MQLSILIRMDSFAFMTIDSSEVTQFEQLPWKSPPSSIKHLPLQELISHIDRFGLSKLWYQDVQVSLEGQFTIVPVDLFESSRWWIYLQRLHPHFNRHDVCFMQLEQIVIVYAYPLALRRVLSTMLPECRVHPFVISMLGYVAGSPGPDPTLCGIHTNGELYLILQSKGKVNLVNKFAATTAADVTYYALMVADTLEMVPAHTTFRYTGAKTIVKEVRDLLAPYFLDFEVIDWMNGWRLPLNVIDPIDIFDLYCVQHANYRR